MTKRTLTIATRGSALALWQANHVRDAVLSRAPDTAVELVIIKTRGDLIVDKPLAKIGGKALFVKEIEQALLDGRADIAVHSMKDVPAELAAGLQLSAVSAREDPADALCSNPHRTLEELPQGARVGTSSLRRQCQLLAIRPDLEIAMLRGNVPTRLGKLDSGEFDAVVLAAAGLVRLGHGDRISQRLGPDICLPAVGQGVLGIETRSSGPARTRSEAEQAGRAGQQWNDREVAQLVRDALHDPDEEKRILAERAFLARLGGTCQTPLAAHADYAGSGDLVIGGMCGSLDGSRILRAQKRGNPERASELGIALAETLLDQGGQAILDECLAQQQEKS